MSEHHDSADLDEELVRVEELLRQVTTDDAVRAVVPTDLWDMIAGEIRDDTSSSSSAGIAPVVDLAARRRRITAILGAAAVLIVGVAGAVVLTRDGESSTVLASSQLAYDAAAFDPLGAQSAANVSLVDTDGRLLIEINDATLPRPDGGESNLEIWLIQPDAEGQVADLVSLGNVDPDNPGEYSVPDGYDPSVYSVVDISVEPNDGVATHSGRSILRGPLVEA